MASADDPVSGRPKIPDGAADAAKAGLSGAADAASGAASAAGDAAKAGLTGATGAAGKAVSGASGAAKAGLAGATGMAGKAASGVSGNAKAGLAGATGMAGKAAAGARGASLAGSGRGGKWPAWVPPNRNGKFPWKWRWLLLPFLFLACCVGGCMSWNGAEDHFGKEVAAAHLECEWPGSVADHGTSTEDATAAGLMTYDMSYRDVTVSGTLPDGATQADVDRVLENGSSDTDCLRDRDIDPEDNPGFRNIAVPAALAAVIAAPEPDPTPAPTATAVPEPTATAVPEPTATAVPEPTEVPAPVIAALAAKSTYDGQTVTLTGQVANEAQRDELVAAAIAQVGEDNVFDQLTIDDGDPSDTSDTRVAEMATLMAQYGGNITDGMASIDDAALTYMLNSPSDEARAALDLPGSGTVDVPDTPEPAFTG